MNQVRYLAIVPKKPKEKIDTLDFLKGEKGDLSSPIIMAVTVETVGEPSKSGNAAAGGWHLLIGCEETGNVLRYGMKGQPAGSALLANAAQSLLRAEDGNLYAAVFSRDEVSLWDGKTGGHLKTLETKGRVKGPAGLAIGPDGNLYVSSHFTNSVVRYNRNTGDFIDTFVSDSTHLKNPFPLVFGPDGDLYVAGQNNHVIVQYDGRTGRLKRVLDRGGMLKSPQGMTLGPDNNLYVSCADTDVVLRFDLRTGEPMRVFASGGGLKKPVGLSFGPDGNLYVCSRGTNSIIRFDGKTGAFLNTFASGVRGPVSLLFQGP